MYPLPAHTVDLVLRYITALTDPLPPHLVSAPLRQRHHFLQLSPSSPREYLCWPSPDSAKSIDLLDRLPPPSDQVSHPTCYTSDPESVFAHVQVSSNADGLRMLFHWDDVHGWRYHDLGLMPFPSPSFSTPQESLANDSVRGPGSSQQTSFDPVAETDHASNDSEDRYWMAYGAVGQDPSPPLPPRNGSEPGGEDAYWAQYASVQGSADSTVPSPVPINRKLRPENSHTDNSVLPLPPRNDPTIDVPVDTILSRPDLPSKSGPPSPNMLARLLTAMSPRRDIYPSDLDGLQSPSFQSDGPSPEQTIADSELVTPPSQNGYLAGPFVSSAVVKVDGISLPNCRTCTLGEEDQALTNSIRGLYYLWKAGREEPDEKDRSAFLRIVQAAIAYD